MEKFKAKPHANIYLISCRVCVCVFVCLCAVCTVHPIKTTSHSGTVHVLSVALTQINCSFFASFSLQPKQKILLTFLPLKNLIRSTISIAFFPNQIQIPCGLNSFAACVARNKLQSINCIAFEHTTSARNTHMPAIAPRVNEFMRDAILSYEGTDAHTYYERAHALCTVEVDGIQFALNRFHKNRLYICVDFDSNWHSTLCGYRHIPAHRKRFR